MIYTPLTKLAMKIAYCAHMGQVDHGGVPYIFHPIHLAEQMADELTAAAALLHDVVEDTPYTLDDLRSQGFPETVIDALELLTHREGVSYFDYVAAIKLNPIARQVKMADLRHNSDLTRLDVVDSKALERVEKYKKALEILTD